MTSISVVACVKNEGPYLSEWIEWHLAQGVKGFYFTENQSDDNTLEILDFYKKKLPYFDYRVSPLNPVQFHCYNYWLRQRVKADWLAFLDCDEFLYSPSGTKLPDILENFKSANSIAAHWVFWGSNGHLTKPDGLVIENYTKRAKKPDKHTKAIVRNIPGAVTGKNPHYFQVKGDTVDENGNILKQFYGLKMGGTADILRINHYHTKSKAEYFERKKLPDPGTGKVKTNIDEMFLAHDLNEVEDLSAARLTDRVYAGLEETPF